MNEPKTMTYQADGRVARVTLNRPERGNGITLDMPGELAACLERANLDPAIHVIALSGNGSGFCGGYDLVENAEGLMDSKENPQRPKGSPVDPLVQMKNHMPGNLCPRPSVLWRSGGRAIKARFRKQAGCLSRKRNAECAPA